MDVSNNFDPGTGVFSLNEDDEEGVYTFYFNGHKARYDKPGQIRVKHKSYDGRQYSHYVDWTNSDFEINDVTHRGVVTHYLRKGDEVKLSNMKSNSIWVTHENPFTFTGYKI